MLTEIVYLRGGKNSSFTIDKDMKEWFVSHGVSIDEYEEFYRNRHDKRLIQCVRELKAEGLLDHYHFRRIDTTAYYVYDRNLSGNERVVLLEDLTKIEE